MASLGYSVKRAFLNLFGNGDGTNFLNWCDAPEITGDISLTNASKTSVAATGQIEIQLADNLSHALTARIGSAGTRLLDVNTTDNTESIVFGSPTVKTDLYFDGNIYGLSGRSDFRHRARVRVMEDFLYKAAAALPLPWTKTLSGATPAADFVSSSLNGEYQLLHEATSGAQTITLSFADTLPIDPTKKPIIEMRLKINFAGAAFSADQRIVFGLASARNATLDSVASNVWFRIEGANLNILWETDDGAADDDDNDSTIDIVDDTFTTFRIDMTDLADIKFYVDDVLAGGGTAAAALTESNKLQPYIEIQRDAGTEVEAVHIDYIDVEWDRV